MAFGRGRRAKEDRLGTARCRAHPAPRRLAGAREWRESEISVRALLE